jgi:hypothetical protein
MSATRYPFQMAGRVPVVLAPGVVLRIFTVTGLDRLIPRFDALDHALAQVPAVTGRPLRPGSHLGPAATAGPPPTTAISACTGQGSSAHAPQPPDAARDAVMAGLVGAEPARADIAAPLKYRRRPPGER